MLIDGCCPVAQYQPCCDAWWVIIQAFLRFNKKHVSDIHFIKYSCRSMLYSSVIMKYVFQRQKRTHKHTHIHTHTYTQGRKVNGRNIMPYIFIMKINDSLIECIDLNVKVAFCWSVLKPPDHKQTILTIQKDNQYQWCRNSYIKWSEP